VGGALTAAERTALEAVAQRLIPTDALGPGAGESGAVVYVERALAGPHAVHLDAYRDGIATLEAAAAAHGGSFAELSPAQQDDLLAAIERSEAPGDRAFFELVRAHVFEGMFGDPVWGGNIGHAGWRLLDYPGPRPVWTEREQQLDARP
jgi:gluconate 2-dehydrogenase gamma chain